MQASRPALFSVLAGVAALMMLARSQAPALSPLPPRTGVALAAVGSWGYQLQGARPEFMPPEIDMLVLDHARAASATDLLSPADVEAFRQRAGAPPRIVLAYLSIGEAETYRAYWWKPWLSNAFAGMLRPGWLGHENKEWKGNYHVRFWQSGWQKLIVNPTRTRLDALREKWFGAPIPYIDTILEAGFDGVYLDRVDAFSTWEKSHPTAEADMSAFVARLSAYAKARRPGFLVVAQNGEELTKRGDYLRALDGIAKEDLMFGLDGAEHENSPDEIVHAAQMLTAVRASKRPVFVVEYVNDPQLQSKAQRQMAELGFVLTFAARELNTAPVFVGRPAASGPVAIGAPAAPTATQQPQR